MAFRCVPIVPVALRGLFLAPALLLATAAGAAEPAGDPAIGARLFLQCRACHAVDAGAPHGVGPNLNGISGVKAGTRPGYNYSKPLAAAGIAWTPENLDAWLKRPTALVPGTKMAFGGMAAPKARQDMIAYLATLKPGKGRK